LGPHLKRILKIQASLTAHWHLKRKKTDTPREGWEDGTPPPHSAVLVFAHPRASSVYPLPISVRSFSPILAATFMPRGRPTLVLVILSPAVSFIHPLTHRSPRPRSDETPLPSADPLLSLLLSPLCVTPPSSRHRKKERKKTDNPREGWEDGTPPPHRDFKERGVMR